MSDAIRDRMGLEDASRAAVNQAHLPGGKRYDYREVMAQSRAVEAGTNIKAIDAANGINKYLELTSDPSILGKNPDGSKNNLMMDLATIKASLQKEYGSKKGGDIAAKLIDKDGRIAQPAELMSTLMGAAHGSMQKIQAMGFGARSIKNFEALGDTYRDAEAEKKGSGQQAVKEFINKATGATYSMSDARTDTTEVLNSKSEKFTASINKVSETLGDAFEPTLDRLVAKLPELEPQLERIINGAAKLAEFLFDHPFAGIGAAAAAAVSRDIGAAGIAQMIKNLISGGGGGGGGAGALGGLGAAAGVGTGIGAIVAGTIGVGGLALGAYDDAKLTGEARANRIADDVKSGKMSSQDAMKMVDEARHTTGNIAQYGMRLATNAGGMNGAIATSAMDALGIGPKDAHGALAQQQKLLDARAIVDSDAIKAAISAAVRAGAQSGANDPNRSAPLTHSSRGGPGT